MISIPFPRRVYTAGRLVRFAKDVAADGAVTLFAGFLALVVADGGLEHSGFLVFFVTGAAALGQVAAMFSRSMYSLNKRYFGYFDAVATARCALPAAILLGFGDYWMHAGTRPWEAVQAGVLYEFVATGAIVCSRVRSPFSAASRGKQQPPSLTQQVLVVGAGDAGETIVREYSRHRRETSRVVALVDDDPGKRELRIHGVPVLGTCDEIPRLVQERRIAEIIVALPSATAAQMRRIHEICRSTQVSVRTLPALSSLHENGPSLSSQLREVRLEDLLARPPVTADRACVGEYVRGGRILITGGGGSIGSELARQIARLQPAELILLGKGENSLHQIEQELLMTTSLVPRVVVADVRDRAAVAAAFRRYRPSVVFHAAAHKHVPLMEANLREAVRNNVYGTLVAVETAIECGVSKFILVSSDKAVRPGGVMGATKRICEMIVSALGRDAKTSFAAVRFGNVLGSRGSLVPVLTAQIRRGGPITVTHPEMTRYFMTIPEAVQLVLQAGAMGQLGEIFILDMGEPVRIDNLARDLIRLHGLVPDEDIVVKYTGVRPGEKLHEELVYSAEDLRSTHHDKIRRVDESRTYEPVELRRRIERLLELVDADDLEPARAFLMEFSNEPDLPTPRLRSFVS